jgi:hypothetical protein
VQGAHLSRILFAAAIAIADRWLPLDGIAEQPLVGRRGISAIRFWRLPAAGHFVAVARKNSNRDPVVGCRTRASSLCPRGEGTTALSIASRFKLKPSPVVALDTREEIDNSAIYARNQHLASKTGDRQSKIAKLSSSSDFNL